MPMRKKTLRRMSPQTRKLAKLIGDLESVTRRLKNYLADVQELELWAKAAKAQKKAEASEQRPIHATVGEPQPADSFISEAE